MPKKDNTLKQVFDEQTPIVRLIIIVVLLFLVFILVKKAFNWYEESQIDSFKDRSDDSSTKDVRPLVDTIYKKLDGYNLYVYPEHVNLLANLNDHELQNAYDYFDREYGAETQMSLTEFIKGEWSSSPAYDPAIEKLERKGLL